MGFEQIQRKSKGMTHDNRMTYADTFEKGAMQRNPHSGQVSAGQRRDPIGRFLFQMGKLGTWVELSEIQQDGATGRTSKTPKKLLKPKKA